MKENDLKDADIVIVGGGPIGYAQAMGFKKLNPELNIVVLEKYPEFQRKHTLVMRTKPYRKLITAIGAEEDARLQGLLKSLQKRPHIRTNVLQEQFKHIAEEAGVRTVFTEVTEASVEEQLLHFNPKLIIGADGTHSVINKTLFPPNNHIKHEIDYAMQIRYEIDGDADAEQSWEKSVAFYQSLERQGLVATQQIGKPDPQTGKTPITVQLIIPKEDYEPLKGVTAKNPIKPFTDSHEETERFNEIPSHLRSFITNQLESVLMTPENGKLDKDSIRISFNELPASRAKQTVTEYKPNTNPVHEGIPVSLNGDSALGLSYFKGLNAGIEALAHYFAYLKPAIQQGLTDKKLLLDNLAAYQAWFSPYADQKIAEVKQYSALKIKTAFKVVKFIEKVKAFSHFEHRAHKEQAIHAYFRLLTRADSQDDIEYKPFLHRPYNPDIKLGQYAYVPIRYTLRKIGKIFVDFFKPYKAHFQFIEDYKLPLVGLVNIASGIAKMTTGLIKPSRFIDGMFVLTRGLLELIMTPLSWTIKPLIRKIITQVENKSHLIEDNAGMQKLTALGEELLAEEIEETLSFVKARHLLGVCIDLHRKFDKSQQRQQKTQIDTAQEEEIFKALIPKEPAQGAISFMKAQEYIGLFAGKKVQASHHCEENLLVELPVLK